MNDLTIERVRTTILDVPLIRPHRFARTGMDAQPILLVTLTTRGGVTGTGEGVVPGGPWWGGESVETMQVIIERYLAPLLLGRRVDDIAGIQQSMDDVVANNLYAKAAVEVALHDAWARSLGVPVHTLLGGLARTSVQVTWALGTEPAAEVVDEARAKLDAGLHTSFKLKMGAQEPADDVARRARAAEDERGRFERPHRAREALLREAEEGARRIEPLGAALVGLGMAAALVRRRVAGLARPVLPPIEHRELGIGSERGLDSEREHKAHARRALHLAARLVGDRDRARRVDAHLRALPAARARLGERRQADAHQRALAAGALGCLLRLEAFVG